MTTALTAATIALALICTLCRPGEARDLPDLVISRADLSATGNCTGGKPLIAGRVFVKNIGIGRGQIFTTRVMLASRLTGRRDVVGADRFVNSMRPGEEVFVDVRIEHRGGGRVAGLVGSFDIELVVDPQDVFRESDEGNNDARTSVVINCP